MNPGEEASFRDTSGGQTGFGEYGYVREKKVLILRTNLSEEKEKGRKKFHPINL